MYGLVAPLKMFAQIVYLGMAVVAWCNTILGTGLDDLIKLELTIIPPCFRIARLKKTASSATAVIVAFIGGHIDKVFLTHHRLDHKTEIIGHRVSKSFSHQLARILNGKFDLQILVPVAGHF